MKFTNLLSGLLYSVGKFFSSKSRKLISYRIGKYKVKVYNGFFELLDLLDLYTFGMSKISNVDSNSVRNIVDLGGYVGDYSIWAVQNYPNSRVYMYEPNHLSFSVAQSNIKELNLSEKIKMFNYGVSSRDQKGNIKNPHFNLGSHIELNSTQGNTEIKSFSNVIDIVGEIDILKVDIEGMEYDLFFNSKKSDFDKVNNILLEFHPFGMYSDLKKIKERISQLGFNRVNVKRNLFGQGIIEANRV